MPWPVLIQMFAPYGVELIEYAINLIQKEAKGEPITADDWRGLIQLYASKSAAQGLQAAVAKLNLPDTGH